MRVFLHGFWCWNSVLHVCKVKTLPSQLLPQLLFLYVYSLIFSICVCVSIHTHVYTYYAHICLCLICTPTYIYIYWGQFSFTIALFSLNETLLSSKNFLPYFDIFFWLIEFNCCLLHEYD